MTQSVSAAPSFWTVARRPKWIAVLIAVLAVASGFALLANWQLQRSVDASAAERTETETVVPLDSIAQPQVAMDVDAFGRMAEADLTIVPGDTVLLSGRVNHADPGWWVVARAVDEHRASLAVAVGWAATQAEADAAVAAVEAAGVLGTVEGRYLPSESPIMSDFAAGERSALAVAELVNLWAEDPSADGAPGVYGGYLILAEPLGGLEAIDAPPPSAEVEFNLLNLFYALEWVVFAGFAVFLWWRLVRDEVEKEAAASSSSPVE